MSKSLKKTFTLELTQHQFNSLVDTLQSETNRIEETILDGCYNDDKEEAECEIDREADLLDTLDQLYKQEN